MIVHPDFSVGICDASLVLITKTQILVEIPEKHKTINIYNRQLIKTDNYLLFSQFYTMIKSYFFNQKLAHEIRIKLIVPG